MAHRYLLIGVGVLAFACGGEEFSEGGSGGAGTGAAAGSGGAAGSGAAAGSGGAAGAGATAGTAGSGAQAGSGGQGGAAASGGTAGSAAAAGSGGAAGSAGSAGSAGAPPVWGARECDVPTNQAFTTTAPSCTSANLGCVVDWAGRFGTPGLADGSAANARFVGLFGLATDGTYIYASTAHAIRRVTIATGQVSTVAGSGAPGAANGIGTAAQFSCPRGLVVKNGNLYVADSGNNRVRQIHLSNGQVSTLSANLNAPSFLADPNSGNIVNVTSPSQNLVVSLDVGNSLANPINNTSPNPLNAPQGLAWIDNWSLYYVADSGNHVIRKISTGNTGGPLIGQVGSPGFANGAGTDQGNAARLNSPHGMTRRVNPNTVFIADRGNHAVRSFEPGKYSLSTVMGDGAAGHVVGVGSFARLTEPTDVLYYDKSLYIAEGTVIRRLVTD